MECEYLQSKPPEQIISAERRRCFHFDQCARTAAKVNLQVRAKLRVAVDPNGVGDVSPKNLDHKLFGGIFADHRSVIPRSW